MTSLVIRAVLDELINRPPATFASLGPHSLLDTRAILYEDITQPHLQMKTFSLTLLLVVAASAALVPPLGSVRDGLYRQQIELSQAKRVDPGDQIYDEGLEDTDAIDETTTDAVMDSSTDGFTDISTDDNSSTDDGLITDDSTTDDLEDTTTEDGKTEATTSTTTTTESPGGGHELSGGEIAGIVIGSLAGVALIAGLIYFLKVKGYLCF